MSVLGTTFAPFGKDSVFALGPLKEKAGASVQVVETGFAWPNQFNQVRRRCRWHRAMTPCCVAG